LKLYDAKNFMSHHCFFIHLPAVHVITETANAEICTFAFHESPARGK